MTQMNFPRGPKWAFIGNDLSLSFDDLHKLRFWIRAEFSDRVETPPLRVLGCLRDDETSLLALLFVTELFDYMPINPNLSDVEIALINAQSGVDVAILSTNILHDKEHLFTDSTIINWDDLVAAALKSLASGIDAPSNTFETKAGRLILHTSGSTGMPKRVPISIDAINASAKNIAAGHNLTSSDHALNALPTFHIGALVDVMLAPFSVGGAVAITDKRTPVELAEELIATRPTWIQIVPTILRRMVEDLEPDVIRDAGASLGFIRSIAAPVPPDLKQIAEELFGCPVVEMYGMTETAGQMATNARDQCTAKLGSVGKPVGVDMAILDRFGNPVESGKVGEVCVNGPSVFAGYEDMAKEDVFFGNWFRTGDLGILDEDGYLFLRGRLKEMINVGGEKISPHEIEAAVMLMPEIIEAAAYALHHPTLGEQVGLTVASRSVIDTAQVSQFLGTRLAGFKCPSKITVLDQLPRLANAKVDRVLLKRDGARALANRLEGTHRSTSKQLTPEAKAVEIYWMRILKCRAPEGEDDFFDMGGDSLSATLLLLELEKTLQRDISPSQLFENPTFNGLVGSLLEVGAPPATQNEHRALKYVRQEMAGWPGQTAVSHGLMRGIGSLKSGTPLFWATQDTREVQAIADTLGKTRPFYFCGSLFRFKKRQSLDFEVLGDQLASEINTVQPSGPLAIGGFCGGAWVMHYAAEHLQKMGREVRIFISFDYWPERVTAFPTVHGMTQCKNNAARMDYAQHQLALPLLHPKGAHTIEIHGRHKFKQSDIEPLSAELNSLLDGTGPALEPFTSTSAHWDMAKRMQSPSAKITILNAPKVFQKGTTRSVRIAVKNTSQHVWGPTDLSGLSVQVDLLNLDNCVRSPCAGFARFDHPIAPGEEVDLVFDLTFPDKRLPLWISIYLASQGLKRFTSKTAGARKILTLPQIYTRPSKRV